MRQTIVVIIQMVKLSQVQSGDQVENVCLHHLSVDSLFIAFICASFDNQFDGVFSQKKSKLKHAHTFNKCEHFHKLC